MLRPPALALDVPVLESSVAPFTRHLDPNGQLYSIANNRCICERWQLASQHATRPRCTRFRTVRSVIGLGLGFEYVKNVAGEFVVVPFCVGRI
jgi:hypothetical protein